MSKDSDSVAIPAADARPYAYAMKHKTGVDIGLAWKADDPKFSADWLRIPLYAAPATPEAATDSRSCTCDPNDNPPVPCAKRYATSECAADAQRTDAEGLKIVEDERDGNWYEFSVNGHFGLIRVVARMEDDEVDLELGKKVRALLLGARPASSAHYGEREGMTDGVVGYAWQSALDDLREGRKVHVQLWAKPDGDAGEVALYASSAQPLMTTDPWDELIRVLTEYEGALQEQDDEIIAPAREALIAFLKPYRAHIEAAQGEKK